MCAEGRLDEWLLNDPTTGREAPSFVEAPGLSATDKGDAAVVAIDLDGNGQQEMVSAQAA